METPGERIPEHMDIADAVTTEYVAFDLSTPVSKLRGAFETNEHTRVVVVEGDDGFEGVVPQTDLLTSHHQPSEKVRSVMRSAPQVTRNEDVRETARLMVESQLKLLPVFDQGDRFVGVVTDRSLLRLVLDNLSALDVSDVFTRDLIYIEPETTLGEVLNLLREHGITRLPVIDEDDQVVGIVSVYDLVEFTVREMEREQGGAPQGFDEHGGASSDEGFMSHGGYGERAGGAVRMLDLPVRDVMSNPVETVDADVPLDEATGHMLDENYSSLLVDSPDVSWPLGIVTTTDVLRALTWEEEHRMPVQVFGVDLLDDLPREAIAERIEAIDGKYEAMDVLEANVVVHQHKEKLRGTPLLLITVRLFTDQGRFSGSGEGYGARAAFDEATDVLEENVLEDKAREDPRQTARKRGFDHEKVLGWWLEE